MGSVTTVEFYEDDEPVGEIVAAFEAGEKGFTEPPRGKTEYLDVAPAGKRDLVSIGPGSRVVVDD